jgi:hypothetical protein
MEQVEMLGGNKNAVRITIRIFGQRPFANATVEKVKINLELSGF